MHWFNKLKISSKLLVAFSIVVFLIIGMGIFSGIVINTMNRMLSEVQTNQLPSVETAMNISIDISDYRRSELQHVISISDEEMDRYEKKISDTRQELDELIKKYTGLLSEENEKHVFEKFVSTWNEYLTESNGILAVSRENRTDEAKARLRDKSFALYAEADKYLNELAEINKRVSAELKISGDSIFKNSIIILVIINAAAMFIAILLGFFIARVITRQLGGEPSDVAEISGKLANGDFTMDINLRGNDRTSALAAMNDMRENLEKMVSEVIIASQNLVQAVGQISTGNQNLSQRTSEQASALEEVAATIEEANSSISLNSDNSRRANEKSENSSQVASRGGQLVEDAVMSINEVNASAKKIGEIINVINEISFQTNLLALNAAVEAARAGEQGRGFAVVAGEVRNLAQRSGNAAKEIAHLINDTIAKVEDGTEKTYKSGEALKEIISSVKIVAEIVGEIAASSNEQKQGMDQIATAIADLDAMTQHNAALVEETASASEEMSNQAQVLSNLMAQFKTRNNTESINRKPDASAKKRIESNTVMNGSDKKNNGRNPNELQISMEKEGFEKF